MPGMRRLIAGLDINERIVHCALCPDKHAVPAIEPAEPPCPFSVRSYAISGCLGSTSRDFTE